MTWTQHIRPSLDELEIYDVPPMQAPARLHANECPEPWPPEVMASLAEVLASIELNRYPDTSGRSLRSVLGERFGCDPGRIVLGNGSDEIISTLMTALSGGRQPGAIVVPDPTFVMYAHSARVLGIETRVVPLDEDWQLDESGLRTALQGASLCFLARPNNPTGTLWDRGLIETLVADHPDVVFVIDEAYIAYAPGDTMWRAGMPANQVYMSTVSKVGLAALRLGFGVAHPTLAEAMNKVRHPYNVSQTSLILAQTVLTRFSGVQDEMLARARGQRQRLVGMLQRVAGARVFPSSANFVLMRLSSKQAAAQLVQAWAEQGVRVRGFGEHPRLGDCIRVSLGTQAELDRLETQIG